MSRISELKIKPIHPFAARMAPEIAYGVLDGLRKNSLILDPMSGSGTVIKTISAMGYNGIGIDIDPLSVLMSSAWTTHINKVNFLKKAEETIDESSSLLLQSIHLPWIDTDKETKDYIKFWFAKKQINDLRKLSFIINSDRSKYSNLLKVALSKLIITKTKGASLAADVSHSRPHRVRDTNDFDVFLEFEKSCSRLATLMHDFPSVGKVKVSLGDARKLNIKNNSVDSIITSPPYLNALDYMRGHKLALVWLGHRIGELSQIRGKSVGTEKAPNKNSNIELAKVLTSKLKNLEELPARKVNMIYRYALDMHEILKESSRVLKKNRKATFVIGNTSQQGVYIENTQIASSAAHLFGLKLEDVTEREIPQNKRYLPPPTKKESSSLKHRMRTEAVMTFIKK